MLAVSLTFSVVGLVTTAVIRPTLDRFADGAKDLTERRAVAERFELLAADLPLWQERARALTTTLPRLSLLLTDDSDALAAAAVQASVQAMLSGLDAPLASIEVLVADDLGMHRRIRLRLSFIASWTALVEFLARLDLATPILLIDEVQIAPARHRIGVKTGALDVSCTIVAFRSALRNSITP